MPHDRQDPNNPEGRFMAMMKDFCQAHQNQAASTEDFKAVVEKHMIPFMDLDKNGRMDWFFNQYVYGTGIPEYRLSYQVQNAGDGNWKVAGKILQSNVAEGWKNLLPLYLSAAGRTTAIGWVIVNGPESVFSFDLPLKPEKLSLNLSEEILADVK